MKSFTSSFAGVAPAVAVEEGMTASATIINLVKCAAGCGMFSLPFAFKQGGLYLSIGSTLFFGIISAYTVDLLTKAERKARGISELAPGKNTRGTFTAQSFTSSAGGQENPDASPGKKQRLLDEQMSSGHHLGSVDGLDDFMNEEGEALASQLYLTYPELGQALFPEATLFGVNWMAASIYGGITLTSLGVCAAYFDFIAATMAVVVPELDMTMWKFITAAIIAPLALLRSFKYLAWSSIVGNFGVVAALVAVIVAGIRQYGDMKPKVDPLSLPVYEDTFAQFFGAASFLFAIHMIVLPLSQSMGKNEEEFSKVTYSSYTFITILNIAFATAAYMLFQNGLEGNVTGNLPSGYVRSVVLAVLAVAMLFTIPMILSASREILEESLMRYLGEWGEQNDSMSRNALRLTLVAIVLGLVFVIKDFNDMVNLVGGVCNCMMGYILPPLLHIRVHKMLGEELSFGSQIFHYLIFLFGVGTLVTATAVTVNNIMQGN